MLSLLLKFVLLFLIFGQNFADVPYDQLPPEKDPKTPSMYWWINTTEADEQLFDCFYNLSLPAHVSEFLYDVQDDVFREENSTNIRRLFNVTMLDWYCEYAYF
uniref:Uncharacterized protein n=1 Tax=Romanomermis culicivorax TaxID=13658 RepID=A0A915IAU5_ROMCU